jgi:hypothetical protein
MGFVERENEIIKTVRNLVETELEFVVVGGYASSALATHRFSVDCDIVIPSERLGTIQDALKQQGFEKHMERSGFDETYGGEFWSYKKDVAGFPVTFDILVGSLVCRATGASWSYDYINRHSVEANVSGLEASVSCRIPQKELLISFKIHSGRRADVRDIVMLMENADVEKVLCHLGRGNTEALRGQIRKINAALEDENLVNSLKGVLTLTAEVKKQIESTQKAIATILKGI